MFDFGFLFELVRLNMALAGAEWGLVVLVLSQVLKQARMTLNF